MWISNSLLELEFELLQLSSNYLHFSNSSERRMQGRKEVFEESKVRKKSKVNPIFLMKNQLKEVTTF